MSTWSDGYVTDIQYTSGFYRELSPVLQRYCADIAGWHSPDPAQAFNYCELACGQGFGTNLLAASFPHARFWGFDFNPAQVANAQRLAARAGSENVTFGEESFQSLVAKPETALPMFDYISFHGIYSWISEENRLAIVEFVRRKLKPGGMVYVSYNSLPGWAQMAPVQRLMREHAQRNPNRSDVQVMEAMEFLKTLKESGALFFKANTAVEPRMEKLKDHNRHYLAHEYLNGFWHPLYFTDVARELEPAKLNFIASAAVHDNIATVMATQAVRDLMAKAKDPGMAQLVRDYAINQQFRRDLFARGSTQVSGTANAQRSLGRMFHPIVRPEQLIAKVQTPVGEVTGKPEVYDPILEALRKGPQSVESLMKIPELSSQGAGNLNQALAILAGAGQLHPGAGTELTSARKFNLAVAQEVFDGSGYNFLAAPAIGSGIVATVVEMLALKALGHGKPVPTADLAGKVWELLAASGRRLLKDGKQIDSKDDTLTELNTQLSVFVNEKIPQWKSLGVI